MPRPSRPDDGTGGPSNPTPDPNTFFTEATTQPPVSQRIRLNQTTPTPVDLGCLASLLGAAMVVSEFCEVIHSQQQRLPLAW